ncbi:ABC transporter permease [Methanoregula sp.]|jgi:putative ABC transport system permease protein|uniref:ABC transporter permease n=1 Tax=Methanoregula sp. TaxID=2052170 RepID=UPI003C1D0923
MLGLIARSIIHRPVRNGALVLAFAFIAASLFSGHYLLAGASDSVKSEIAKLGADLIVVPANYTADSEAVLLRGEPSTFFFDDSVVPRIRNVSGVEQVEPQIFIASLTASCCSLPVQLIAIDPAQDFTIAPWLEQKREKPLGPDEIIVGSKIVAGAGTNLTFFGHSFRVVGKLDPTGTGLDTSIFLRTDDAYKMANDSKVSAVKPLVLPQGVASAVLVRVNDAAEATNVSYRIVDQVPGTRVLTSSALVSTVSDQLAGITRILDLSALVATLVSLPLIALISLMVANERRREIGVLRALGATRSMIFRLILGESVIIAAIGGIIGIGSSWIILVLFQSYISVMTRIPLSIPAVSSLVSISVLTFVVTVAVGGLAALYPAVRSALMEPYEAIRSGEL